MEADIQGTTLAIGVIDIWDFGRNMRFVTLSSDFVAGRSLLFCTTGFQILGSNHAANIK